MSLDGQIGRFAGIDPSRFQDVQQPPRSVAQTGCFPGLMCTADITRAVSILILAVRRLEYGDAMYWTLRYKEKANEPLLGFSVQTCL